MPKALQHECPYWSDDTNQGRVTNGALLVWPGVMRIVHGQRARKLRKRGVPLMPLHAVHTVDTNKFDKRTGYSMYANRIEPTTPNGRARYAWFEPVDMVEARKQHKSRACYLTHLEANRGVRGRKAWLHMRLQQMRREHTHFAFWRNAPPSFGTQRPPMRSPNSDQLKLRGMRSLLGDRLSDELLAQRNAGQHFEFCDCAACDGSLDL